MESSLAKKSAELDRREKELKVREDSQRNLLMLNPHEFALNHHHHFDANDDNVSQWDEDRVGVFVRKIVGDLRLGMKYNLSLMTSDFQDIVMTR